MRTSSTRSRFRRENGDLAKRAGYVYFDLVLRTFSAVALVALGAAGWWFQVTTQRSRDAIENRARESETRDRKSRKCLPVIRSLTELELMLDDTGTVLLENDAQPGAHRTSLIFAQLSAAIESAAVGTGVSREDIEATVALPDFYGESMSALPPRDLGIRATSLMFAELLTVVSLAVRPEFQWGDPGSERDLTSRSLWLSKATNYWRVMICVRPLGGYRVGNSEDLPVWYVRLRPETVPAWIAWLETERSHRARLDSVVGALPAAALAIRQQVARASQGVMRANPEFGDHFVAIRADAMRSRRPLIATR
jgi:hypothetical protein